MTFTPGKRLGQFTRAPRGTPVGYIPRVSAVDDIIEWVPSTIVGAPGPMLIRDETTGVLGFLLDDDGNPIYAFPE